MPLATSAPMTVSVWRDRGEHVVEATHPGYQTARQTIRYDKAASLSVRLNLQRDSAPVLQAVPERRSDDDAPKAPERR